MEGGARRLHADRVDHRCRHILDRDDRGVARGFIDQDRKSTRLNSSHVSISYAVFCFVDHRDLHSFPTRRSSDLPDLADGLTPFDERGGRFALRRGVPRMRTWKVERAGFTLIELIIVVVIFSIVTTAALPAVSSIKIGRAHV